MEIRPAEEKDLDELKQMYRSIVKRMRELGRPIWSDYYPAEVLIYDIKAERMFVLIDQGKIVGAFCLDNEPYDLEWQERRAPALYLERLAVSTDHQNRGLGGLLLGHAFREAEKRGAEWLRLFVVRENSVAARLYEKCGMTRLEGLKDLEVDRDIILHGYGYEKKLI